MTTSNALLASLAIIKANWDESQGTYIDNFLPFFLDAVRTSVSDDIEMQSLHDSIHDRFGMQIPLGVLTTLSKRAARQNYGRRENGLFIRDPKKIDTLPSLDLQKSDYLRKQSALVNELMAFTLDKFKTIFTETEAEDALLAHVEEYSTSILGSFVRGDQYPAKSDHTENPDIDYIVNSFISHVVKSLPESFAHLEAVVKGSMLAVSLYLPDASEIGRGFDRTTLYLDTPLIVRALGFEGTQAKSVIDDLLTLCRSTGAEISCFEHNVDEVKGILNRASRNLGGLAGVRSQRRQTDIHFESVGTTSSDILLLTQSLEDNIAKLDIRIAEKPVVSSSLTIDELELERQMDEEMGYSSRDALLNDLDSLTAIHRLRNGRSNAHLETCRAILVTSNGRLARIGQAFFVRGGDHQWPVAITDHHLTTLVWLKKPHAAPDLPRRQILADCFAALEPGKRLWERYLVEIDRLGIAGKASESDLMILRYSTEAERGLMERTLGNPANVNSESVTEILEKAKAELAKPSLEARDNAMASELEAREELLGTREILRDKERRIAQELISRTEMKDKSVTLNQRINDLENSEKKRKSLAKKRADRQASRIYYSALVTFGAFILTSVLTLFPIVHPFFPNWLIASGPLCLAVSTAGGLATLYFGGSIKGSAKFVRSWVANRLEKKYLRQLGF
ncbi:hypothetical protein [Arthrobacter psychrolactophilus]|uniref:hypothetical protein n=1 Tax=Arthrobacter psychrolactophilus TaxID=92442 RepID=UPI0011B35D36|nr:hypothetical protein [Arthrobacter psychrolactophilus]